MQPFHMGFQVWFLIWAVITQVTGIRLIPSVNEFVNFQMVTPIKYFLTHFANVCHLPQFMNFQMFFKILNHFGAVWTFYSSGRCAKSLLLVVSFHVFFKVLYHFEAVWTFWDLVRAGGRNQNLGGQKVKQWLILFQRHCKSGQPNRFHQPY